MDIYFKLKYTHGAILNFLNKNFKEYCTDEKIKLLEKDDLKLLLKYQQLNTSDASSTGQEPSEGKDAMLLAIAQWTYHNGNEDSFEFLCEFDLTTVNVKTLMTVIRDYPNMREDACFKERLFDIGQQSEEVIANFIRRFCEDLTFYDTFSPPENEADMVKRPELKTTSSRRFMNSVRFKKKQRQKEIVEIKEESKEQDMYDSSDRNGR